MTAEKLKLAFKLYRAYVIIFVAAVLIGLLTFWLFRGYGGNANVGKTIETIRTTTETTERRADNIIDAAKHKEEETRNETREKMAAVSDDALPDLLAGLLRDYRKQH